MYSIYFFFLAFTSAFSPSAVLNIPTLAAVASFATSTHRLSIKATSILPRDLFAALLILVCFISYTLTVFESQDFAKRTNYIASVIAALTLFYYTSLLGILNLRKTNIALISGVAVVSIWSVAELFLIYMLNVNIDAYIPRAEQDEYRSTALSIFQRSRGPVSESGHLAFYLITIGAIAICELLRAQKSKPLVFSFCALLASGLTCTFSVAAIIELPLAMLASFLLFSHKKIVGFFCLNPIRALLIVALCLLLIIVSYDFIQALVEAKAGSATSFGDRAYRLKLTLDHLESASLLEIIFGHGPGTPRQIGIPLVLNAFILILFDYGITGITLFLLFLLPALNDLKRIKCPKIQFILSVALLSAIIHLCIIPNYWYPWLWFLLAYIRVFQWREKLQF